jgi:hypothetical protein
MKAKLLKRLDNDTDFEVHVFKLENGRFAISTYDSVLGKYDRDSTTSYPTLIEALRGAKKVNDSYYFI